MQLRVHVNDAAGRFLMEQAQKENIPLSGLVCRAHKRESYFQQKGWEDHE